jgi:hypothetical protein
MSHELVIAHACCMFTAFGICLPIGTFLAHTGYHKIHVYCQVTGIVAAIVGFIMIVVNISNTHGKHFEVLPTPKDNPHTILGLLIIILATTFQPFFIVNKMVFQHHKNGALILALGFINVALGLYYLTSASQYKQYRGGFLTFYLIWVAAWVLNYIFDPFRMRQGRLIELARMRARGKDTAIDLKKLLDLKIEQAQPEDPTIRKSWEVQVDRRTQKRIMFMSPGSRK